MTRLPGDPTRKPAASPEPGLDAAQQSLSDALRVSFGVLKALMLVLLVVYALSGLFQVAKNDTAVRYRFGERIGVYGEGYHFALPFPIEQVVRVPGNPQKLDLNESFWYHNPENKPPAELANKPLNPLEDSFLITGDTNVVHVQFQVTYRIDAQDVEAFLRNVGSLEKANELVRAAAERGMIHWMASAKVEDIIIRKNYKDGEIRGKIQQALSDIDAGITVMQVLIDNKTQSMPNQVRSAYEAVTQAQADKVKQIQQARRMFDETLGKTAGGTHTELMLLIRAFEAAQDSGDAKLAGALRATLDGSIGELRLPRAQVLDAVRNYQDAVTAAAGSDESALITAAKNSATTLSEVLGKKPADAVPGKPIAGEIAASISRAKASRSEIATKARLDYERYASALEAYRKTPLVLANDRLQATREKVMTGLVQTIIGPITRVNTTGDPEVQEELSEADLQRRREKAQQEKANEGR